MRRVEIFKLFGSIFVDNEEANKSIAKTEEKAEGLGSKLGNGIKTAAKWGAAIVTGATAAGGALLGLAKNTADYAGEVLDMSRKSSLSVENLQQLKYAGDQAGVSMQDLVNASARLARGLGEAADGNKTYAEAFEQLGISITDAEGNIRSTNDVFNETLAKLAEMGDTAEAARIGNDLFGKGFANLKPLLAEGADGIEALKNKASELGLVMSEDAIKAGDDFGDSLDSLKETFSGIVRSLSSEVIPMFQAGVDFIAQNMPTVKEIMGSVFDALSMSFQSVVPLIGQLVTEALPPLIALFSQIATEVLPPVIDLFTNILQAILPPLITLLTGVVTTILPPLIELFKVITNEILPPFIEIFNNIIAAVLPPYMELFEQIINTLLPPFIDLFKQIIENIMPPIMELFGMLTEEFLPPFMELINEIVKEIMPPLLAIFNELAQIVLPLVMEVFEALMPVIEPIMNAILSVIKFVLALIKGDWEAAWGHISDFFSSIWEAIVKAAEGFAKIFGKVFEAIKKVITGIWDGIVNSIKSAINFIISGINLFIRGLNKLKIPDWVPGVGGKGLNLKEIPLLAAGGEITQKGHAIVGEAGPELLELPQGAKVKPLTGDNFDYDRFGDVMADLISGLGGITIQNMSVRDDTDIEKIAQKLFNLQQRQLRAKGAY